jgi:Flp pilus assembly protein TadD
MQLIGRALWVAVSDPTNPAFREELHALTDHRIGMVVSSEAQIEKALDQYYGPMPAPSPSPLEDAVGRSPVDAGPWMELGNHYGSAGQYELARIAFGQAARFGPSEAQAHWGVAKTLFDLGRHAESVAPARKAVSLCPSNRQARLCLGRALAATNRIHQAIEQFEEASRLSPDWPVPLAELGFMHGQRGDHRAAAEHFEASLRLDPDQPKLWTTLGFALSMSGAWQGAAYALETAVFARPTDAWSRALLGKAHRKLDRTRDAHDSLAEAVRLGFDEPWAWFELGDAAVALGDQSSLERAHERLLKLDLPLARKLSKHLVRKPTSQLRLWFSNIAGAQQEAK